MNMAVGKDRIMIRKHFDIWVLFFLISSMAGCALKWESAIREVRDNTPTQNSRRLLAKAQQLYDQANDLESLSTSIDAYQAVLLDNPGDYEALVQLSNQYILMGTAYASSRKEKSELFLRAMKYAELAMYTNTKFKAGVNSGKAPWEAVASLEKEQTEAIFFWVTALQYEFKESMSLAAKIRNVDWMQKGLIFLDRIEQTNPDYGGGAVEFAKAICYYVLPKSKGGSKKIGEAYLQQAVEKGKGRLLPRWGRGKYFYPMIGNNEKSREDLSWVAAQNLQDAEDAYPWKVYFQKDARDLIK